MDRDQHQKYVPDCPRNISLSDQYLWAQRDTNKYTCINGLSDSIYDCRGDISYTLPLEMYPAVDSIHPQIPLTRRMHLNFREDPRYDIVEGFTQPYQYRYLQSKYRYADKMPVRDINRKMVKSIFPAVYPEHPPSQGKAMEDRFRENFEYPGVDVFTNRVPGYPLPDPYEFHPPCKGLYGV